MVFHRADITLLGFVVYHVRLDLVFFVASALVSLEFYTENSQWDHQLEIPGAQKC